MRVRTSIFTFSLCITMLLCQTGLAQTLNTRAAGGDEAAGLESMVPRDGLQFYVEVRRGGLLQLARVANAFAPFRELFGLKAEGAKTADLATFLMANLGALSNARVAVVGYESGGAAMMIEAANASDGEQLGAGLSKLLNQPRPVRAAAGVSRGKAEMEVSLEGRLVMAGARTALKRIAEANGSRTLGEDQEFMKARARFADDPFFAYVELTGGPVGWQGATDSAQSAAYTAGMLAALNGMPYAVAMGGSLEADTATLKVFALYGPKQQGGLFSGIFSALGTPGQMGHPVAASFAAPDTDLFVDLMIDWDKLYESIQSMLAMFASSMASAQSDLAQQSGNMQSMDLLAMAESSLGFSIKYDLIPTLGNEVAITLSGFDKVLPSTAAKLAAQNVRATRSASPRFMLMLALRDPAKFEKLLTKLFNRPDSRPSQAFARLPYRGATISYRKDMAYAITGGFFIAGGSLTDIRQAIDARALGNGLASSAEFRSAMGEPRPTVLQAYVSAKTAGKLFDTILSQAAKTGGALSAMNAASLQARSGLSLTILNEPDGLMAEVRVPTSLTVMALASLMSSKPAAYGIGSHGTTDGVTEGVSDSTRLAPRGAVGRRTPRLTDEDLRDRRP